MVDTNMVDAQLVVTHMVDTLRSKTAADRTLHHPNENRLFDIVYHMSRILKHALISGHAGFNNGLPQNPAF